MRYVGKYGEYRVLACLLKEDVEAYQAIKTNQPDFDLTAIVPSGKVVRIQVKSTELHNKSTNNAIDRIDKQYDFLVVVIIDAQQQGNPARFFILTKSEALAAKGSTKQLGVTQKTNRVSQVKSVLLAHEDKWGKIKDA